MPERRADGAARYAAGAAADLAAYPVAVAHLPGHSHLYQHTHRDGNSDKFFDANPNTYGRSAHDTGADDNGATDDKSSTHDSGPANDSTADNEGPS